MRERVLWERERGLRRLAEVSACGEHAGDPKSIEFFVKNKISVVSCSAFRVLGARLAVAKAQIQMEEDEESREWVMRERVLWEREREEFIIMRETKKFWRIEKKQSKKQSKNQSHIPPQNYSPLITHHLKETWSVIISIIISKKEEEDKQNVVTCASSHWWYVFFSLSRVSRSREMRRRKITRTIGWRKTKRENRGCSFRTWWGRRSVIIIDINNNHRRRMTTTRQCLSSSTSNSKECHHRRMWCLRS